MIATSEHNLMPVIGWREWIALPQLDIEVIKAKVDSGARTSALHAFEVDPYHKGTQLWVMFIIHPEQNNLTLIKECHAPVKDRRMVTDSGGHKSKRFVIETQLVLGWHKVKAEITLTNRDTMKFRMLLGRTAMRNNFLIDPAASFLHGHPTL